jgi:hypothetical protein
LEIQNKKGVIKRAFIIKRDISYWPVVLLSGKHISKKNMGEYRISNYEKAEGSSADDNLDEFFLRLAFEF